MSQPARKNHLSPCAIIERYEKTIKAVAAGDPSAAAQLNDFILTMQPQDSRAHLELAKTIYLHLQAAQGKPTEHAAQLIDRLIEYLCELNSNEYFQRKCKRENTDYGVMAAHKALFKGSEATEAVRLRASLWLIEQIKNVEYEYARIDPELYYQHLKAIRHTVPGLLAEPSLRKVLIAAQTFSGGLMALDHLIGADARRDTETLEFVPHAAIPDNLLRKFDTLIQLNSDELTLGERQREKTSREASTRKPGKHIAEFRNKTLKFILAQLRREGSEAPPGGKVARNRATHNAETLLTGEPHRLSQLINGLSAGDTSHPWVRRLKLQAYAGAEKPIIQHRLAQMLVNSQQLNTPHPAQNAAYTLSELFDYWAAIQTYASDKRLPAYLMLLMLTGLDESRARTLTLDEGPDTANTAQVYLNAHGQLCYNLADNLAQTSDAQCITLALSPWLAERLRHQLVLHPDGFSDIAEHYAQAKKALRATHPDLPRYLSQWLHGARELLGQHLSDFEIDVISGQINARNRTASAYIEIDLKTLNKRLFSAYQHWLERLAPAFLESHPWLTACLNAPEHLPEGKIGSTRAARLPQAAAFTETLYARHRTIKQQIKQHAALGRIHLPGIIDELNLICINYWLMTQWLTTGRGHFERLSLTDAGQYLVVEDKDASHARLPRICAYTNTAHTWLNSWRNQYQIIVRALRVLQGQFTELLDPVDEFLEQRPNVLPCLIRSESSIQPHYSIAHLSRARLEQVLVDWEMELPEFPSNLPRHLWWSQQLGQMQPDMIRQQLGHQTYGIGLLSTSSSAVLPGLNQQMEKLTPMLEQLNLKVLTFSALPLLSKEGTK